MLSRHPRAWEGLWPPRIKVSLLADWVSPVQDDRRESLGADGQDPFARLGASAAWSWFLGDTFGTRSVCRGLSLHLGVGYFREYDQAPAWRPAGFDEYTYVTSQISQKLPGKHLREVYVLMSDGRLPTGGDERTTYLLGVVVVP